MYSRFHRFASRFFPFALAGALLLGIGPAVLLTVAQASLLLAQLFLELCQMGLVVLRVCGI